MALETWAVSAIELLNPPLMALVMVDVPWLPCTTLSEAGDADRLKLAPPVDGVRKATICMIHAPGEVNGAVAL